MTARLTVPLVPRSHAPAATSRDDEKVFRIRSDFPILQRRVHGKPLVYLDNGATTQKPQAVLDAITRFYETTNANIHRGSYVLSREATGAYEDARETVAKFLGAQDSHEVIFTRGTTESVNLVANAWGRANLKPGDEIILSILEHHSNIVPWQMVCEATGAVIKVIPMADNGELLLDEYAKLLSSRTRIVAITHVSNALGTINDVKKIAAMAHVAGALCLVDGAQWVAKFPTNVEELGVDFYAFSGHKLYGPTGIGALWGRREILEKMPPFQGGGDMIESVSFAKTTYAGLPNRFEAGTPNLAGAVGLQAAIDYVQGVGFDWIARHEAELLQHATAELQAIPGIRILGTAPRKAGVVSFQMEAPCVSALDLGTALDLEGIAVRTGHHCCQPLMDRLHVSGTVRISFGLYNTLAEVDACANTLRDLRSRKLAERPWCIGNDHTEVESRASAKYPPAYGATPTKAAEELIEAFDFLEDWPQRYEYLIDLGKKLLPVPAAERTEANRVKGCQSTVYLSARRRPGTPDVLEFLADSDADIVSGLIAVLQRVFSGQRASDVLAFDVEEFFNRLGIDQHLALTRRNGLAAMVQRIRALARAMAEAGATCTKQDCVHCADGTH